MSAARRLAALVLLLAAAPAPAQPAEVKTVHVLIAAEVTDPELAPFVRMDVKTFRELLADHLPADRYRVTVLTGPELTATAVRTHYQTLKVDPADGLLFYYSGHGSYRGDGDPKTPGDLHTLEFQADPGKPGLAKFSPEAMTRRELRKAMLEKKAALTVILTDCCSDHQPVPPPKDHKPRGRTRAAGGLPEPTALGKALFLTPARGAVDMTAAAEGQVAISDKHVGSYFTAALERVADKKKDQAVDWKGFAAALTAETQRVYTEEAQRFKSQEMLAAVRDKSLQLPQTFELPTAAGKGGRWAVVALDNPTDRPVRLQIRWGTTADWSRPFSIAAGKAEYLAVPQPAGKSPELTFQVKVAGGEPKTVQAKLVTKDIKPTGQDGNVYRLPDCSPAK
jgi:hypothetical protein